MGPSDERRPGLIAELARRGVFRVVAIYGAAAFVALEVADIVLPALFLPPWAVTAVVVALALGFPVVVVLAWIYDLTPDGIERTGPGEDRPVDWRRVGPVAVLASLTLVAAGVAAALVLQGSQEAEFDPGRVVVAAFENRTGDPEFDAVGQMAADWVTRRLAQTGMVEVIPSERWFQVAGASLVRLGSAPAAMSMQTLAEQAGASTVVTGAVYLVGDSLRIESMITDVASGRVLAALDPVAGPASDPGAVVDAVGTRVAGTLASLVDPRLEELSVRGGARPTWEAYQAYARAREAFTRLDFGAALQGFATAHARDSTFIQPLVWSALAYWFAGRWRLADSLAVVADGHRDDLLPAEAVQIDFVRALVRADRQAALESARRGYEATGDGVWAYMYGTSLYAAAHYDETVEVFARLDPEGPLLRGWWAYWSWPLNALHLLERFDEAREMAARAAAQYPGVAPIRQLQTRALVGAGRPAQAEQVAEEMMYPAPRGAGGTGADLLEVADELAAHGHADAALRVARRAVRWFEDQPAASRNGAAYGRALRDAGRADDALAVLVEAVDRLPELAPGALATEERVVRAAALGQLGLTWAALGRAAEARAVQRRLEPLEVHPVSGLRRPDFTARIAAALGERDEAISLLEQAFANGAQHGIWTHASRSLQVLRGDPAYEALVGPRD